MVCWMERASRLASYGIMLSGFITHQPQLPQSPIFFPSTPFTMIKCNEKGAFFAQIVSCISGCSQQVRVKRSFTIGLTFTVPKWPVTNSHFWRMSTKVNKACEHMARNCSDHQLKRWTEMWFIVQQTIS